MRAVFVAVDIHLHWKAIFESELSTSECEMRPLMEGFNMQSGRHGLETCRWIYLALVRVTWRRGHPVLSVGGRIHPNLFSLLPLLTLTPSIWSWWSQRPHHRCLASSLFDPMAQLGTPLQLYNSVPIVPLFSATSLQVQMWIKQTRQFSYLLFDFCLCGNAVICQAFSLCV